MKSTLLTEWKIYRYRRKRPKRLIRKYGRKSCLYATTSLNSFYPFSIKHLREKIYINNKAGRLTKIIVPEELSFYHNFDNTMLFFGNILFAITERFGNVLLDFSKCKYVCISAFTLLDIIYEDFLLAKARFKFACKRSNPRVFKIIPSDCDVKVKKYLHSFGYYKYKDFKEEDGEFLALNIIRGKYRYSYKENTKTKAIQQIVDFINKSFEPVKKCLSDDGRNTFESLVSEILNNAEDHSVRNGEWYVNGIAFNENQKGEDVVELNLSIMNFGYSMYEGFEGTKEDNCNNYDKVNEKYNEHSSLFTPNTYFERESLFMLYMLNEGISRLKYEDQSRGNGTMQFLEAFTTLGSFGGTNANFNSLLNVISGHTVLTCDNKVYPYSEQKHLKLSLNEEKKLSLLPDKKYLKYNKCFFPGTIIECKIYLNEGFFNETLKNEE